MGHSSLAVSLTYLRGLEVAEPYHIDFCFATDFFTKRLKKLKLEILKNGQITATINQ